MYLIYTGATGTNGRVNGWFTRDRLALFSSVLLAIYVMFLAVWAWSSHGFTSAVASRPGLDFSVFWSAARMTLHGHPMQVYDWLAFKKVQASLNEGFLDQAYAPWLYPPTVLLLIAPLALVSQSFAYALFAGASTGLFVTGTLRISSLSKALDRPRTAAVVVAAAPCVFVSLVIGQNALLTAGVAAFGLYWMGRHPLRAGICIGLLALKPQLGIVFPFVLIAAREWRVLAITAVSALSISAIGVLCLGPESLHGFVVNTNAMRSSMLEVGSGGFWLASPTAFAALRLNGVPVLAAYVTQACLAVMSIACACYVWFKTSDTRLRASIVVVSTLLVSPYLWHYELAWLGIALVCLTAFGLEGGWMRGEQEVIVLGWLLPLYEHFNRLLQWPQIGPVVVLLVMLIILRRVRMTAGGRP